MDIATQRFIMISSKILAELRNIATALGALGNGTGERAEATRKNNEASQEKVPPPYVQPIVDISEAIDCDAKTAAANEPRYQNRTFWLSVAGVVAVVAYTTVAAFQWCTMNRTYGEIQAQTKNAIDVSRKQFSPYIFYGDGRIDVSTDRKRYNVSIQLKNFGQTPAYSVRGIGSQHRTCRALQIRSSTSILAPSLK